jgi:hypothetical protein
MWQMGIIGGSMEFLLWYHYAEKAAAIPEGMVKCMIFYILLVVKSCPYMVF